MLTLDQAIEKLNEEYRPVTMVQAAKNMYWILINEAENDKKRDKSTERCA